MKKIALLCIGAFACLAQTPVTVTTCPFGGACSHSYIYSGSNLVADCMAQTFSESVIRKTPFAISAVSKANPAVVTATGHGFPLIGQLPLVTITGATGTGWTGINATWTATIIDANTFSIPIDSSGFGTLAGTVTFTTSAPRLNQAEWAVKMFAYDGSNNLVLQGWLGSTSAITNKCSDASVSGKNVQ